MFRFLRGQRVYKLKTAKHKTGYFFVGHKCKHSALKPQASRLARSAQREKRTMQARRLRSQGGVPASYDTGYFFNCTTKAAISLISCSVNLSAKDRIGG